MTRSHWTAALLAAALAGCTRGPHPLSPGTFAHAEITEAGAHHLLGRIVPAPVPAVA